MKGTKGGREEEGGNEMGKGEGKRQEFCAVVNFPQERPRSKSCLLLNADSAGMPMH